MICFRDMTFCSADCYNTDCGRYFSELDAIEARRWWSHDPNNAPIAFCDYSATCPDFQDEPSEAQQGLIPVPDGYAEQ